MAFLKRARPEVPVMTALFFVGCAPIDLMMFGSDSPEDSPPAVTVLGLGGHRGTDGDMGLGGQASVSTFLLDDFADGDQHANDPAGWWYIVNDGTGTQTLGVVPSSGLPAAGGDNFGPVLEISSQEFSDWGAAWGVDVLPIASGPTAMELRFDIAADRPVEVAFHAIDGTGDHFTRTLIVDAAWSNVTLRLDHLFIVTTDRVRGFDVTTADELQWFIFDRESVKIWLDNVSIRSW